MEIKKVELTRDEFKAIVELMIEILQQNENEPELFKDMKDRIETVSDIIIDHLGTINKHLVSIIKEKTEEEVLKNEVYKRTVG